MKTFRYKDFRDGEWYEAKVSGINNALPIIQEKIERNMPVETVDADKLKKLVASLNITCHKDLTKEEANKLVTTILGYIIGQIDKAEKYYVDRSQKIKKKGE